uniref:Uncharacterized protein n=1 Tax=Arcella intermedia TaxID=1963864 RepID=A0A6B2L992_9EUKA
MKILCLGVGGCGKTTFVKQMKIIHGVNWDPIELQNFIKVIRGNYISGLQDVIEIAKKLGKGLKAENEDNIKQLKDYRARNVELGSDQLTVLRALWVDPVVQEIIKEHPEKLTITHLEYFWNNLDRITQDDYSPSDEDILRARMRTAGANSSSICIEKKYFEFFDVGGQKPERAKWQSILEEHNFSAIIYFVASDEYDVEDEEKEFDDSKMHISRLIFSEIVSSGIIDLKIPIILFLNRDDLFEERMKDPKGFESFKQTFPDYGGGADKQQGLDYLKEWFTSVINQEEKHNPVKVHYTCALDTESLVVVWRTVREALLKQTLDNLGLG